MSVPNDYAMLEKLQQEGYFEAARKGDQRGASLFARLFAFRMNPNGDPGGWGALKKGGGTNVDGYAEDAVVYGSNPSDLDNVVDTVAGAGAPGATLRWGPAPRRASDVWEAPRALSAADLAFLKGETATEPGGGGEPSAGWTPAHNDLLLRLGSKFGTAGLAQRAAEQFAHSFPSEGWSAKAAAQNRPQSADVIARMLNGQLVGYRVVPPTTNPGRISLTGQHKITVTATDHLGTGATPPKPLQPGGSTPGSLPDRNEIMDEGRWLSAYYASLEGLQRPQGLSMAGAPDWEGVGAWLFSVYLVARIQGKTRHDARAEYVRQIRHSAEWAERHPGETP